MFVRRYTHLVSLYLDLAIKTDSLLRLCTISWVQIVVLLTELHCTMPVLCQEYCVDLIFVFIVPHAI